VGNTDLVSVRLENVEIRVKVCLTLVSLGWNWVISVGGLSGLNILGWPLFLQYGIHLHAPPEMLPLLIKLKCIHFQPNRMRLNGAAKTVKLRM